MGKNYYTGTFDATTIIVTITSALSLYNALELVLLIFTTFTSYRGLYFWSLLVATTGLIPYAVGLILSFFCRSNAAVTAVGLAINNYGWWATITGQSVVLYSRLGVVLGKGNERILKYVKWMIIIDAILLHITTTVVFFGSTYAASPARGPFSTSFIYVEKIQMTVFCIQEFIISGLYLWKTVDIVKTHVHPARADSIDSEQTGKKHIRRVMWQLFIINLVIVGMDIALLVVEYKDLHIPEVAFKELCYSVKLKLEFAVLSKLVEVAGSRRTFSIGTALDMTADDKTESMPRVHDTSDFAIDTSRKRATEKVTRSISPTSTPAEWVEDLEKIPHANASQPSSDLEKTPQKVSVSSERKSSTVSTFNNISVSEPPVHRRVRRDSDLLYADAIREMSKN